MEQRDLIKDQIEQIGKVLGAIIAGFFGLKAQGKVEQGIEISNEKLKEGLDIDINKILNFKYQKLSDYLDNLNISSGNIEKLIDYVIEIGEHKLVVDKKQGVRIFERVLEMYDILDAKSNIYSFARIKKEERIKELLEENA
jgi:hypothetical protein